MTQIGIVFKKWSGCYKILQNAVKILQNNIVCSKRYKLETTKNDLEMATAIFKPISWFPAYSISNLPSNSMEVINISKCTQTKRQTQNGNNVKTSTAVFFLFIKVAFYSSPFVFRLPFQYSVASLPTWSCSWSLGGESFCITRIPFGGLFILWANISGD